MPNAKCSCRNPAMAPTTSLLIVSPSTISTLFLSNFIEIEQLQNGHSRTPRSILRPLWSQDMVSSLLADKIRLELQRNSVHCQQNQLPRHQTEMRGVIQRYDGSRAYCSDYRDS